MPAACQNTKVMLPINFAAFVWGCPDLFIARMRDAGSEAILLGPYTPGDPGTAGIDTPELLAQIPDTFRGYNWTNTVESIGPLVRDPFK